MPRHFLLLIVGLTMLLGSGRATGAEPTTTPPACDAHQAVSQVGFTFETLPGSYFTKETIEALGLQGLAGAAVTHVSPQGPAYGKIEVNDLIINANGATIVSADWFWKNKICKSKPGDPVSLTVIRGDRVIRVEYPLASTTGASVAVRSAPRKLALLIANQDYAPDGLGKLANPINDIEKMSGVLKKIGFRVAALRRNHKHRNDTLAAVQSFAHQLGKAGKGAVGFFYYSGHGLSPDGLNNYLLPTGVTSSRAQVVRSQGLALEDITRELQTAAPAADHIVVFDACRTLQGRGGAGQAFAAIDVPGMFIAFSTSPGRPAKDKVEGLGAGPFAHALAAELAIEGQSLQTVFDNVSTKVFRLTKEEQLPWVSSGAGQSSGVKLNGELTRDEQDLLERDAKRLAIASEEATDRGDATLGALLALEALPKGEASQLKWDLTYPAQVALDKALQHQRLTSIFVGHSDLVLSTRFSPDGKRLVTASDDGTARIWDGATGAAGPVLRGHQGSVVAARFDPTGKQIVTVGVDGTARVWNSETGAAGPVLPLSVPADHDAHILMATLAFQNLDSETRPDSFVLPDFSPDGQSLLTRSAKGTITIWNTTSGKSMAEIKLPDQEYGVFFDASFSPRGQRILTTSNDFRPRIWNARTGEMEVEFDPGNQSHIFIARFNSDASRVLTLGEEGVVRLWDAATGKPGLIVREEKGGIVDAVFNHKGDMMATVTRDHQMSVWNATSGALEVQPQYPQAFESIFHLRDALKFSLDDQVLLKTFLDEQLRLTIRSWKLDGGDYLGGIAQISLKFDSFEQPGDISPDGKTVLTVHSGLVPRSWRLGSVGIPVVSPTHGKPSSFRNSLAEFSPDGKQVLSNYDDDGMQIWDAASGKTIQVFRGKNRIFNAAFSPDGQQVFTASDDNTTRLWDIATGKAIAAFNGYYSAHSHDGKTVITTADRGNALRLWDVRSGAKVVEIRSSIEEKNDAIDAAEFNRNDGKVLTWSVNGLVELWDAATGKRLFSLAHEARANTAHFSPDGTRVITASDDGKVRLWSAETGKVEMTKAGENGKDGETEADFNRDGTRVMVNFPGGRGTLVWAIAADKLIPLGGYNKPSPAAFSPDNRFAVSGQNHKVKYLHAGFGFAQTVNVDSGTPGPALMTEADEHLSLGKFSSDGKRILALGDEGQPLVMQLPPVDEALVTFARNKLPMCLHPGLRDQYYLSKEPPAWCRAMKKWPYDGSVSGLQ